MAELQAAKTILQQLGGRRFIAMTGARNLVGSENSLSFAIMRNAARISHVRIALNGLDLYDVEFLNIRGGKVKIMSACSSIYFDQLRAAFESATGLRTNL